MLKIIILFSILYIIHNVEVKILVTNWSIFSKCTLNSTLNEKDSNFNNHFEGFLIDMIKDFPFEKKYSCLTYEYLISEVKNSKNKIGLIPYLNDENNKYEFNLSYPFLNAHLNLVSYYSGISPYFYLSGFSYGLWISIFVYIAIFSHFFWFFERCDDGKISMNYFTGIRSALWESLLSFQLMGRIKVRSLPGRILVISAFSCRFLISIFLMATIITRIIGNYDFYSFDESLSKPNLNIVTLKGFHRGFQHLTYNKEKILNLSWNDQTMYSLEKMVIFFFYFLIIYHCQRL